MSHTGSWRKTFGIFVALFTFGFTIGLLTGWSRDSVVGSLLSGLVGLFGGVVLAVLATKREGNSPNLAIELVWNNAGTIACGTIIMCLSTLSGTTLGINIRNGYAVPILLNSQEPLLPVATTFTKLPPGVTAKLIVAQHEMDKLGYDRSENNILIKRYANALESQVSLLGDVYKTSDAWRYLLISSESYRQIKHLFLKLNQNNGEVPQISRPIFMLKICRRC